MLDLGDKVKGTALWINPVLPELADINKKVERLSDNAPSFESVVANKPQLDAHWHGFRVFGGVPGRGIYDNMKTAVDRVGRGKERQVNVRFQAMTNH